RTRRKAVAVAVCLSGVWVAVFLTGWAPPDRFVANGRKGAFVDWHLHGGDVFADAIDEGTLKHRERTRGVSCAVMTAHSSRAVESSPEMAPFIGTEWSGPFPAMKSEPWRTPHFLVLG